MAAVAEAYLHIKGLPSGPGDIEEFGALVSKISRSVASRMYPADAVLEVRVEAGSIRSWSTVGVLLGAYTAMASYSGFKESLPMIVNDAKTYSELVIDKVTAVAMVPSSKIYRKERRTKTPGKLLRVLTRREWLEAHRQQLSQEDVAREERSIAHTLTQALADMDVSERQAVAKALEEEVPELPKPELPRIAVSREVVHQGLLFDGLDQPRATDAETFLRRYRIGDGRPLPISLQKSGGPGAPSWSVK